MPDTGVNRHDGTSSEEESDEEIILPKKKTFGIRVAQSPQQAKQQVLSQIGGMANERQSTEVVVQQTEAHEKTDAEKAALEQRQKLIEAQNLAKAQQAAALQAAAARVAQAQAQAQGAVQSAPAPAQSSVDDQVAQAKAQQAAALQAAQESARKAQQEALARAQAAQNEAQAKAKAAQEAQMKAQQEAIARAQEAQKKAQQEAMARAQEAQKKAQEEAQARARAQAEEQAKRIQQAQAQAQNTQKTTTIVANGGAVGAQSAQKTGAPLAQNQAVGAAQAQKTAVGAPVAQKSAVGTAQAQGSSVGAAQAQKAAVGTAQAQKSAVGTPLAQNQSVGAAQAQKSTVGAPLAQKSAVGTAQVAQKPAPQQVPQKSELTGTGQKGALAQSQPIQQEVTAAAGPKWSRTPGKCTTQGPQPEQPRQAAQVAPPQGNTALRQTVQVQEQELAQGTNLVKSPMMARKPQIQAEHLVEKFVEKPEQQLDKMAVQKGQQLEGAKRWVADSTIREAGFDMQVEKGPKATILADDACWQTQRRVPFEIQTPQVGKITIPELTEKDIQRTIVAQPASYHKVQWNEFPEEPKYEKETAPKTKTQEWTPVNNEQNELQRSLYKPARIAAVWPPPQDELVKEGHSPLVVKANEDTTWIQQNENGVLKQAVWGKTSRINRVWPPPENENAMSDFSGPQHMPVVQWPPPESEAHEREQVEVLQKHIPTKKMERQWPPPPPQYQVVESSGEIETRHNPAEMIDGQTAGGQQQVIRTVIRSQ